MDILLDKHKQQLVRDYLPGPEKLKKLAAFFDVLSDRTRLKIVSALSISPMCVSDLSAMLELNQTTLSHQLSKLRTCGIVDYRRQGKISFYYMSSPEVSEVLLSAINCS